MSPPVALVTGAAGAIGGAICAALVIDGWVVIAGDRAAVAVDGTCPDAARLVVLTFDITDEAAVDDAIREDRGGLWPPRRRREQRGCRRRRPAPQDEPRRVPHGCAGQPRRHVPRDPRRVGSHAGPEWRRPHREHLEHVGAARELRAGELRSIEGRGAGPHAGDGARVRGMASPRTRCSRDSSTPR